MPTKKILRTDLCRHGRRIWDSVYGKDRKSVTVSAAGRRLLSWGHTAPLNKVLAAAEYLYPLLPPESRKALKARTRWYKRAGVIRLLVAAADAYAPARRDALTPFPPNPFGPSGI